MTKQANPKKAQGSDDHHLPLARWKLEDAKARFSEVVRRAREKGPQRVTVRGQDAVVVMSVEEFERLVPPRPQKPFVEFMESLHLAGVEPEREIDRGRDIEL